MDTGILSHCAVCSLLCFSTTKRSIIGCSFNFSDNPVCLCIIINFVKNLDYFVNYAVEPGSANVTCRSNPAMLVFVNEVLLKDSHTQFIYVFSVAAFMVQWWRWVVSRCGRDHLACKAWNVCYLSLYKKSLPTPLMGSKSNSLYLYKF